MKLVNTSSSNKSNCFVSFLLLCLFGLTSASTTEAAVFSGVPKTVQVATTNDRFNLRSLEAAVDRHQTVRRLKKGRKSGKKAGKKSGDISGDKPDKEAGKKSGNKSGSNNLHKYTKKSKCTTKTTPLENGGSLVTKTCVQQFTLGKSGIKSASSSGRTETPVTSSPSATPSALPTSSPTSAPTSAPTFGPSSGPTAGPTTSSSSTPTSGPSSAPGSAEIVTSTLPNEATTSSKTVVGALVGGVLGFVVLAAGAKAVESVWSRRATSDSRVEEAQV